LEVLTRNRGFAVDAFLAALSVIIVVAVGRAPVTIRAAHQCAGNPFEPTKPAL